MEDDVRPQVEGVDAPIAGDRPLPGERGNDPHARVDGDEAIEDLSDGKGVVDRVRVRRIEARRRFQEHPQDATFARVGGGGRGLLGVGLGGRTGERDRQGSEEDSERQEEPDTPYYFYVLRIRHLSTVVPPPGRVKEGSKRPYLPARPTM